MQFFFYVFLELSFAIVIENFRIGVTRFVAVVLFLQNCTCCKIICSKLFAMCTFIKNSWPKFVTTLNTKHDLDVYEYTDKMTFAKCKLLIKGKMQKMNFQFHTKEPLHVALPSPWISSLAVCCLVATETFSERIGIAHTVANNYGGSYKIKMKKETTKKLIDFIEIALQ